MNGSAVWGELMYHLEDPESYPTLHKPWCRWWKRSGRAARAEANIRNYGEPHVCTMDPVIPRSADADEPMGERAQMGDAHTAVCAHPGILVARRSHRARHCTGNVSPTSLLMSMLILRRLVGQYARQVI